MNDSPAPRDRRQTELPDRLAAELSRLSSERDVHMSALIYGWLVSAARLADEGYGHLLPQIRRAQRGTIGATTTIRWRQSKHEYDEFRTLIKGAGSTVAAVLREAAQAYVAAGGDPVAMAWPPKSRGLRAVA